MNLVKRLACASTLLIAPVGQAQTCGTDIVFDMSPMPIDMVWGEYMSITSIVGDIVHAKLDATLVSNDEGDWSLQAGFQFPTGVIGIDSVSQGWKGTGTFSVSIESDALNGTLAPPFGSDWSTWLLIYSGGTIMELPGGGLTMVPMDGYFSELKLTLTFADCPIGDLNGDFSVNVTDLLLLIGQWGACPPAGEPCPADLTADGIVNVEDLLQLIGHWGSYCAPPFC